MALFKSGNNTSDQYASYSNKQLIDIVTDKTGNHSPDVVEAARRILLVRGHDYRTKEQKDAEKQLQAATREQEAAATIRSPRTRIRSRTRTYTPYIPSSGYGLKTWHWIIIILIRAIACLARHS
jgi:hypothetical protein